MNSAPLQVCISLFLYPFVKNVFFFVIQLSDTGTGFSIYIHIVKLSIEVFYSCHNGGLSKLCVDLPLIMLDIFFSKKKKRTTLIGYK